MKAEMEKILEELVEKHTREVSDEDSDGNLSSYDYFDKEEFAKEATSSITALIIKWLESKKQTEGYINLAMENCNQLITELIGELR